MPSANKVETSHCDFVIMFVLLKVCHAIYLEATLLRLMGYFSYIDMLIYDIQLTKSINLFYLNF